MNEWKKYEASRNAPRPPVPPKPGRRVWVEVVLAIVAIVALYAANYVVPARGAECLTDSECMMMHGGDGGPGPLDYVKPVRLPSGAILKYS